jgi:hypothetical protein
MGMPETTKPALGGLRGQFLSVRATYIIFLDLSRLCHDFRFYASERGQHVEPAELQFVPVPPQADP